MNSQTNPYSPGAGTPPPELAGRAKLIDRAAIAIDRIRAGRSAKSLLMVGLRGVGKTVLLTRIRQDAEARGIVTANIESPEQQSLPALLAPQLRSSLLRMSRLKNAGDKVQKALRALAGFVKSAKLKYGDVTLNLDLEVEQGLADTGDLDSDLIELMSAVGEAAKEKSTALALFIDELQYVQEQQLASLISALHRCAQESLPVTLIGAGLPQLVGNTGKAKSYAERQFDFPVIGPLDHAAAKSAILRPAQELGVQFTDDALEQIVRETEAYPYFLQEWGKHCWGAAQSSPITTADVDDARQQAVIELDTSFFRVRLDRLTPSERRYLRAMAELGPGPHRSGDISQQLKMQVRSVAPVRASLIQKGMIYSPAYGDTAFTVPLFDQFMKRAMQAD